MDTDDSSPIDDDSSPMDTDNIERRCRTRRTSSTPATLLLLSFPKSS